MAIDKMTATVSILAVLTAAKATPKKEGVCEVCKPRKFENPLACEALQTLQTRTQNLAGVKKLCEQILHENTLRSVATKLNSYPVDVAKVFLTDITPAGCRGGNYLCGNVGLLNSNLVEAWKAEYDALNPSGVKLRNDFETLRVINRMQTTEQTQMERLFEIINANGTGEAVHGTAEEKLQVFLKRYSVADCQTCGNVTTYGIPTLAIVWENAKYVIGLYNANLTDAYNLLSTNTFLHPGTGSWGFVAKSGVNHMISDIRRRSLRAPDIEHLDQGLTGSTKRYDLKKQGNKGYIEYKSYTEGYGLAEVTGIGSGNWKDFDQFIAYLSQSEVIDLHGNSLEYVFDAKKIPNVTDIKNEFRKMILDDSNPNNLQFKPQGITVFNTIWSNAALRQSLFGQGININNPQDRADALDDFKNWIINSDNRVFGFINVK